MKPTPLPDINDLLSELLLQMQKILGQKLVGLYLYGSLVTGDFDRQSSDIDLLTATVGDIDETEFNKLKKMHNIFVLKHKEWEHRLEIAYLSLHALKTFKTQTSQIAIISPGEPFHFKEAGKDWLMNWYIVREKGVTLFGPPPEAIIEPVSKEEYIQCVKDYAGSKHVLLNDTYDLPTQAYVILTMCRALYTCKTGKIASKIQAARWAAKEMPAWASTIRNALLWRQTWRDADTNYRAAFPETQHFVTFMIEQIFK